MNGSPPDRTPPGSTIRAAVRITIGEGGRITTEAPEPPKKKAVPEDEATRARNPARGARARVVKLEPSPATVRTGLELSERWKTLGDDVSARRVADAAAKMAPKTPGASDDPELSGRLAVRTGEAALARGDLDEAGKEFRKAEASGASDRVREEAQYLACETLFYAGQFDSAAAGTTRSRTRSRPAASPTTRSSACT
jgi:hypothetical protein